MSDRRDAMIYLDYAATTPLDPRVYDAMRPFLEPGGLHANPASDHAAGRRARAAVEEARTQVAALIGAEPGEIIWTSGATEADNLAIKGALEFYDGRRHVVTARTEHKAVLDTCRALETRGVRVTYLTPGADGRVAPEQVAAALTPDTALVSLMWVNNETGVIHDIARIAALTRARGVLLHVDAAQAAGRIEIDLQDVPLDLMSLSAHKAYGPKGIGALFVRKRPRARLVPQMHGGGHEQGMRSGTLATHQIAGMGAAFALARAELARDASRIENVRDRLWQALGALPQVLLNGADAPRVPGILNVSFAGVEGESLRAALPDLAVSSGAACSSATREPSYVLRALGRDDELANASLRFSFGRFTTEAEIDQAAASVVEQVRRLRRLSKNGDAKNRDGGDFSARRPHSGNPFGYSAAVWRLFNAAPRAGGWEENEALTGTASTPANRNQLRLQVKMRGSEVGDARFQAYGCPTTIAVGAWLAERAVGRPLEELARIRAAEIRQALEIPEDRTHCALLGEDVVKSLQQAATR